MAAITTRVLPADPLLFPGAAVAPDGVRNAVDCNSPSCWVEGRFVLFNSYSQPWRITGRGIADLDGAERTVLRGSVDGRPLGDLFVWIESVIVRPGGLLYGFLHYEPDGVCTPGAHLPTAPKVIAVRSHDAGLSWDLLGVILEAPQGSLRCDTASPWDSGGHGDFSVIEDSATPYAYLFFSSYVRDPSMQGICAARLALADLDDPVGRVAKWHDGAWISPGLGGPCTPILPSRIDWHRPDADIFWGPSIHWNTAVSRWIILMSHAVDTRMTGDGTWMMHGDALEDPGRWSAPRQIVERAAVSQFTEGGRICNGTTHGWYPQVVGTGPGGTDTRCGRQGRLFLSGVSRAVIEFASA